MAVNEQFAKLSRGLTVPGTTLQTVLMDTAIARKEGVSIPEDYARESIVVWALAVGQMGLPKLFTVYGATPEEAIKKAIEAGRSHG